MSAEAKLELKTLTIRIPMRLARRGGRKLILTPDGATPAPQRQLPDDTMVKALVRAHRWRRRIESGEAASIMEVAEQEGVTAPYVFRLLRLTCLAPQIVAAILCRSGAAVVFGGTLIFPAIKMLFAADTEPHLNNNNDN